MGSLVLSVTVLHAKPDENSGTLQELRTNLRCTLPMQRVDKNTRSNVQVGRYLSPVLPLRQAAQTISVPSNL